MTDILFATQNPSKAAQVQSLFGDSPIRVRTAVEAGIKGAAVEDGTTLEENAEKKARYVHARAPGAWVMAEDTGFFIDALSGEPGIFAARWLREGAPIEETMRYCLKRMDDIENRAATFRAAVVVLSPSGEKRVFVGEVSGTVLTEPRCAPLPSMPYSAIFVPNGEAQCWAEMDIAHENSISHRGKAFRQVRDYLERAY